MTEEFDLHLLEFTRAEGEIARRNLVAEALADLADSKRNTHSRAVADVLEVDEDTLRRLRAQEGGSFLAAEGADKRLEHQIELARRRQRAQFLGIGSENQGEVGNLG